MKIRWNHPIHLYFIAIWEREQKLFTYLWRAHGNNFSLRMSKYTTPMTLWSGITNWNLPPAWKAPQTCSEPSPPAMAYCIQSSWNVSYWSIFTLTQPSTRFNRNQDLSANNTWRHWLAVRLRSVLAKRRCSPLWRGIRRGFLWGLFALQPLLTSLRLTVSPLPLTPTPSRPNGHITQ